MDLQDLEEEKLKLEIEHLKRPIWLQPNFLTVFVAAAGVVVTLLTGILTGYFDVEEARVGFNKEKKELARQIDSIQNQLELEIKKGEMAIDSANDANSLKYNELDREKQKLEISLRKEQERLAELSLTISRLRKPDLDPSELEVVQEKINSLKSPDDISVFSFSHLTEKDLRLISNLNNIALPILMAAIEVESRGTGFLANGDLVILFEGHVFWRRLVADGKNPEDYITGNENILFKKWTRQFYLGGEREYERLNKAMKIDSVAALESCSWGMFQIMGYHYEKLGFTSVEEYVDELKKGNAEQVQVFLNWLSKSQFQGKTLLEYLRNRNWDRFARGYNGPGYTQNKYDQKLKDAYTKYSANF